MALKALNEGLKSAAGHMRNLADASLDVAQINDAGGPVGGAATPPAPISQAPVNMTFVSNIAMPTMSSGGGGGGSGSSKPSGQSDDFLHFLWTRGIYDIQKTNEQTILALKQEFEFLLKKALAASGGLAFRKQGMG